MHKRKRSTSTSIFTVLTFFLTLGKIQDGGQDGDMFADVTGLHQRHRP